MNSLSGPVGPGDSPTRPPFAERHVRLSLQQQQMSNRPP
jgi:hypothetical protein